MIGRHKGRVAWAGLLVAFAALAGCQADPYSDKRLAMRANNLKMTAGIIANHEITAPQRFERDLVFAGNELNRAAKSLENNSQWFANLAERDVIRFQERSAGEYQEAAAKLFGGKPETIPRTAITLFW